MAQRADRKQLAFRAFADVWKARRGYELANASDNAYRLGTICRFALPGIDPPVLFAYMFGNEVGERVKPMRELWTDAVEKAGLTGLQMRDLRHEAGSRFMEAGMPISYVSNMLGHTNLTTTSRYLNINVRVLHREMEKFEAARRLAESVASSLQENAESAQADLPQSDANSAELSSKPMAEVPRRDERIECGLHTR